MTNIFINNIDEKLFVLEGKDLEEKVLFLVKKIGAGKSLEDIGTIYYVSNEALCSEQGKIITSIKNIKVLISDNFPYILRHLASHKKVSTSSFVVSNNLWELYLGFHVNTYTCKNSNFSKVNRKNLTSMFDLKLEELKYLNDYIFLQEKNPEDSLGKKKTITLLTQYDGLNNLYENRDKLDNIRSKALISYQANKIKFYIDFLKPMFLTSELISND